jgi:predicted Zn-dependent protease
VEKAVRTATGPEYYEARKKLDAGEVRPALDLLARELERRPKNRTLAMEVVGLCEAARMTEEAKALTKKAVEAGNEVPELLMRYAENLADDPAKAREVLRKAAQGDYPPAAVFLRLGKAYAAAGDRALAEACWRRGFEQATAVEKSEIHSLMGTVKASGSDE